MQFVLAGVRGVDVTTSWMGPGAADLEVFQQTNGFSQPETSAQTRLFPLMCSARRCPAHAAAVLYQVSPTNAEPNHLFLIYIAQFTSFNIALNAKLMPSVLGRLISMINLREVCGIILR